MNIDNLNGHIRLEHSAKNNEYYAYDENGFICGTLGCNKEKLQELIDKANRFTELQSHLQQAEEREAALREALETILRADEDKNFIPVKDFHKALKALSPSQPSKYDKMLVVVEAARELLEFKNSPAEGVCIGKLRDTLFAYDKAGDGETDAS